MPSLTNIQLSEFNQNGAIVINDVFNHNEIEELRNACYIPEIQEFLNQEHSGFTFHWLEISTKHIAFMKLAKHPKIISLIRPILGENIQLQHSKLAIKPPGKNSGTVDWHQDFAFFPHTNTALVAVMIAIDDIGPKNGGMKYIKGSHKRGLQNHLDHNGFLAGNCNHAVEQLSDYQISDLSPNSGGISIHHCLTIHRSDDNLSHDLRRAIIFEYRADDALQLADGIWKDTGIIVSGNYQRKVKMESGTYNLPHGKRYGKNQPFGHAFNQLGEIAKLNFASQFLESS